MTPLYVRMLGDRFPHLQPQVRLLHEVTGKVVWRGEADVARGTNPLCRLAGWITSLPRDGAAIPLEVRFEPTDGGETWTRTFGNSVFRTRQFPCGQLLCERAGPVTFRFRLAVEDGALSLQLDGMRVLGVPVPRFLHAVVATREWEEDGLYRFDVRSELPLAGLLVHYRGWLKPA